MVGAPLRLVRLGDAALAREGTNALHLVFAASVAAVDAELATTGRPPSDPRRFRPNIVLAMPQGDGVEFIEESLAALEWQGGAAARACEITAPCVRCVAMNVDPASARVDDGRAGHADPPVAAAPARRRRCSASTRAAPRARACAWATRRGWRWRSRRRRGGSSRAEAAAAVGRLLALPRHRLHVLDAVDQRPRIGG